MSSAEPRSVTTARSIPACVKHILCTLAGGEGERDWRFFCMCIRDSQFKTNER